MLSFVQQEDAAPRISCASGQVMPDCGHVSAMERNNARKRQRGSLQLEIVAHQDMLKRGSVSRSVKNGFFVAGQL